MMDYQPAPVNETPLTTSENRAMGSKATGGGASHKKVRVVEPQDYEQILALCRKMHEDSRYNDFDFDISKITHYFRNALIGDPINAWVALDGDKVVGFLCAHAVEHVFCKSKIAQDIGFYIRPDARDSLTALRMVRAFLKWAEEQGVREVLMATTVGHEPKKVAQLFEACGLQEIGTVHARRF